MLKHRRSGRLLCAFLLCCVLGVAHAQEDEEEQSLKRPQRLTSSVGDQFLGQLAANGRELSFLSNRNTTTEPFVQDLEEGRAKKLFDEGADITWPRRSPQDHALLYISYRDRAGGQLCVRDLPSGENRRCLDDGLSALQAEWMDEHRVLLLARASVQDDLQVLEVRVGATLSARPRAQQNLSSPAISPNGRWLVYVPLERTARALGPGFAAQASPRLEALRLDREAPPVPLLPALPGRVGQPAFSRDGHLYFVQFFSDSNEDGAIDAGDRGVLFRVSFPEERDDAPALAAAAMPEQLTDASWNCQYPAPAADRLITTCARNGNLDVYELPLAGEVPVQWGKTELRDAIKAANRRADQLLLWRHRLTREVGGAAQRFATIRLTMLHLELEDFDAAEFYARHLDTLDDPQAVGVSRPLLVFIEHRRALRNRELGRRVGGFREAERTRLESLAPRPEDSPAVAFLGNLVRSEIAEALGDYARARTELEAASVAAEGKVPRALLEQYARRADAFYRLFDEREGLVRVLRQLAQSPSLPAEDQLDHARAAARALVRGRPQAEADAALARAGAEAPADSELAFAMELGRAVLAIQSDRPPPAVRERLLALFAQQPRADRRRAVVMDAVKRASELGADGVIERLSEAYLAASKKGTAEWRMAVRLYRRALAGRAYRRLARGRRDEAKADFDAVTQKTGAYESLVASIDVRLRSGLEPEAVEAELSGWSTQLTEPQRAFMKAYLLERRLRKLQGEEHAAAVKKASELLRSQWSELKLQRSARALSGVIQHEAFLVTGNLRSAERANSQYRVALELVGKDPRSRASILGELGLLQGAVGNHRLALSYLEQREKLPYTDGTKALSVRLARAKALLHTGHEAEAADAAERALLMLTEQPRLERYRALVLGRVALYSLAARRFERALAAYDLQLPLLEASQDAEAARNRLFARLGRSAAALGDAKPAQALADLEHVDRALADPAVTAGLHWSFASRGQVLRDYRLLAAGMRVNAHRQRKDFPAAERALEVRRSLLLARFAHSQREETLRQLVQVEAALAANAADRADSQAAARWLDASLQRGDELLKRSGVAIDPAALDALWLAAQLQAAGPLPTHENVAQRLRQALKTLAERNDSAWRTHQRWFEIYLPLLEESGGR